MTLHSRAPTEHPQFDPLGKMGRVGKLFGAVKRVLKRVVKPCLRQKFEAPQYESAAQGLTHVQTGSYPNDECPTYAEVDPIRQQQTQYDNAFQAAPYDRFHQPEQVQSPQESHHHRHQHHRHSESLIQATSNTFRSDELDGYAAVYVDPGPPVGYIITETGYRIPYWRNPPQDLPPPGNHGLSYF